jgi:hypothetical protein
MIRLCLFLGLIISMNGFSQTHHSYNLPKELNEISGIASIGDTLIAAINDGGNEPLIYLLNFNGEVVKSVFVKNSQNVDWEDIASDGIHLYIGDIGNNTNKRKDLSIYIVSIDEVLTNSIVDAKKISYNYEDQIDFPPNKDELFYDAEGLAFYKGSLWVLTKNRSSSGTAYLYKIPKNPGNHTAQKVTEVFIGENGWLSDGITAFDITNDIFYALTYDKIFTMSFNNNSLAILNKKDIVSLKQRESLIVLKNGTIWLADEKHMLLGDAKLYEYYND